MKSKLTVYDISYIMKKFRLKTVEDFADFGLRLTAIGSGCSRNVYAIRGYNLVVKIPFGDDKGELKSARRHAMQEYKAYRRIANERIKKYKPLRKYLPEIHCHTKDGLILMDKYKVVGYGKKYEKEIQEIRRHANYLFPENDGTDMYGENIGRDAEGNLVILDFGCFFRW